MKRHATTFALTVALTALQPAYAAVGFESVQKKDFRAEVRAQVEEAARPFKGKTFWFEPNSKAIYKLTFLERLPTDFQDTAPEFRPTGKISFVVTDVLIDYVKLEAFAEITFDGGAVGYLRCRNYLSFPPFKVYDADNPYMAELSEVVYAEDPEIIRQRARTAAAAQEQKRIADEQRRIANEKAWKARGGVRIGMTKEQVLASNWGKPKSVNRTTDSLGVSEQWVYGGGNYLYFINGILTSVQN